MVKDVEGLWKCSLQFGGKECGLKDNAAFRACVCAHVYIFEAWYLYGGLACLELFL